MALSESAKAARQQRLIDSARALIHESGTGFSMLQLAKHAGVSPATPYNLLGSKNEVLRHVIRDEFARFTERLAKAQAPDASALEQLLQAIALVVVHYAEEPNFYRGLYQALTGPEVRSMMGSEGRTLWLHMVAKAMDEGSIAPRVSAHDLTMVLLRAISSTTMAWLGSAWTQTEFAHEMTRATHLPLLGLLSDGDRARLLAALPP